MTKATHQENGQEIDQFIAENLRRWLAAIEMLPEQLHNRVHEKTNYQGTKMVVYGQSYGSIPALRDIAHELGLKLQDIVAEPIDMPKALLEFAESKLAPKKDAPDHITDEEWMILRSLRLPRRRLTPECYYLALQMIRKAGREE